MGDVGDTWREFNEASKEHRTQKQEWSKELITEWAASNEVEYKQIAEWQIRLIKGETTIDIYPQRQKYHKIKPTQQRGQYKDLITFLNNTFK